MIEWRPCTEQDIDAIQPYPTEMVLPDTLKRDLTNAVVFVVDGVPIGAGGVQTLYPGVGEAWTLLSDEVVTSHPMAISRFAIRWLDKLQETQGLVRIQTMCEDSSKHLNWLVTLGFSPEGLLRNAGIGGKGDYWICGRIR